MPGGIGLNEMIVFTWTQLLVVHQRLKHVKLTQSSQYPQERIKRADFSLLDFLQRRKGHASSICKALLGDILPQPDSFQVTAYPTKDNGIRQYIYIIHNSSTINRCAANIRIIV